MKQFRQGDVLLTEVKRPPVGAVRLVPKAKKIILATGERTGHAHVIDADKAVEYSYEGQRYLRVTDEGAQVVHEEHATLPLEAGTTFKVDLQREAVPQVDTPPRVERRID